MAKQTKEKKQTSKTSKKIIIQKPAVMQQQQKPEQKPTVTQPIKREAPVGVKVISILNYIGGFFLLIAALFFMLGSGFLAAFIQQIPPLAKFGLGVFIAIGVLLFILSVVSFAIGYGLWKLKEWARITELIFSGIGIVISIGSLYFDPVGSIFQIIINGVIIWYLMKPEVKMLFH